MSNFVQSHRQQPTRLPHPWDSPGKNTGVGCHFLLQCMTVKRESEVTQWCPTLCDPIVCSLPGSSVHGLFQVRVLEWDAIAFSDILSYSLLKQLCTLCDLAKKTHSLSCFSFTNEDKLELIFAYFLTQVTRHTFTGNLSKICRVILGFGIMVFGPLQNEIINYL